MYLLLCFYKCNGCSRHKKNSSCTCGIGNELSFFREKTGVLPDSVNFLSFIDNLHETGPSEPGGITPPLTILADTLTLFESG